jgi:hypothetical protein
MIKIEKHPNLTKWINVFHFDKLIEQETSHAKALKLAKKLASKEKLPLIDKFIEEVSQNG